MTKKSKLSNTVFYVSLLTFILFVVYVLYINQEVFYTVNERSEFLVGAPFFHTLMSKPFGLMQYAGAWLTQLFYRPAIGSAVLAVIWLLIFLVGIKAFRLQQGAVALMLLPIACLLTSVVDLGYWIYISKIRGYWFSQSLGYLTMLLLLWPARCTPRKWHLVWYLFGFCIYPVLGWFALLFILCLILSEKLTWREIVGFILLLFTANIWHTQFYSNLKFDDVVLAGLPRFITPLDHSERPSIPFWALGAVSMLIPLYSKYLSDKVQSLKFKVQSVIVPVVCAVAGIVFTCSLMFQDRNYIDEMRMVRYAEDDNWKEVLALAENNKRPTSTMVFLKNVALMNEGGLLDRSFKLGNDGANFNNPDSIHVGFLNIASPLVYYNYGLTNEATRLAFENAIQAGFSPFYLKMLSRCALAKGNQKMLAHYTTLLHHHPYYSNWQPAPVSAKIIELQKCYPDELTGVENSENYVVNTLCLWYEANSKVASEQALFYAMIRCNSNCFWPAMRNYVKLHRNEQFPVHAQEAYIIFLDKAPEEKRMILPVEENIFNQYKKFLESMATLVKPGKTLGMVAEEMRGEWGATYWYYYFFGEKYSNAFGQNNNEIAS